MKSCTRAGLLATVVLSLCLAGGCTGSEVIETGNTAFLVEVPIANPEFRFDVQSLMVLSGLNIRPNDPDADAALGPIPIGVLATQADLVEIDFSDPGTTDPTSLVLSSGSYRISTLQFANLLLLATRQDPFEWDTCPEYFFFDQGVINFSAEDLGDLGNFIVPAGGVGALTIGIDATAFVDAFTDSWMCTPPPNPIPIQFQPSVFKARAPEYLTIRSTQIPG